MMGGVELNRTMEIRDESRLLLLLKRIKQRPERGQEIP